VLIDPKKAKTFGGLKIYLAGKVAKNDWRHRLVSDLSTVDTKQWRFTRSLPMGENIYIGPFFVSCDHGCAHGVNSHGAGVSCEQDLHQAGDQQEQVFWKSCSGIRACDVFIVWADENFSTAYGTLTEIGMAYALKKPIVFVAKTGVTLNDQWFARECAGSFQIRADDPVVAVESLLHVITTLRGLNDVLKDGVDDLAVRYAVDLLNQLDWYRDVEFEHHEREERERQNAAENLALLQNEPKPLLALPSSTIKTKAGAYEIETTISVAEEPKKDWMS
jgi:nucleoside 2-deoxyribosyltransferase